METGFLSAIHDKEHYSSHFYSQSHGLDVSEVSLLSGMIVRNLDFECTILSITSLEFLCS